MLRAASLARTLLTKPPAGSFACSFSSVRIRNGWDFSLGQPAWKPVVGIRRMNTYPGQERIASPGVESAFRERDKVPPEFNIIYRAPLQYYITVTYFSAWVTILIVPAIIASMFLFSEEQKYPYEIGGIPIFDSATDAYLITGMLLLVIVNIATTVAKYPFRIYKNAKEDKYVAVFQHFLPGMVSKKEFVAGEVKKSNGWIWKDSCYAIKKKKVLLIPDYFSRPVELLRMQEDPKQSDPVEIRKRRSKML